MRNNLLAGFLILVALLALAVFGASFDAFSPGRRTLMLAHNAFPTKGQWADRLDRALSCGTPLVIEIDLAWVTNPKTGKNDCLIGVNPGSKDITGNEPTLKSFFFERVRPIVEKALQENDKQNWPLVILYMDMRNDPPEQLEFIWKLLGEYENWLTTAVQTNNPADKAPLDVKPLVILTQDKDNDIKEEYFYNRLPIGGKLRVFSTAKLSLPPGEGLTAQQIAQLRSKMKPEELVKEPASNYRRWWHSSWGYIETAPMSTAGEWTPEKKARLEALVNYGHKLGYLVGFYCVDGFDSEAGKAQGWNAEYNFGSLQKANIRWRAAAKAGVDFVTTSQYEELAKVIKSRN